MAQTVTIRPNRVRQSLKTPLDFYPKWSKKQR
jgi:hypothetical protein